MGDVLLSKELLPCPFCGEMLKAEWHEKESYLVLYHKTMLCDCPLHLGMLIFAQSETEAVEKWNRRADDASDLV